MPLGMFSVKVAICAWRAGKGAGVDSQAAGGFGQEVAGRGVFGGDQAGQGDGLGIGDEFDAVGGGPVRVAVGVLAEEVEAALPAPLEFWRPVAGEPLTGQRLRVQMVLADRGQRVLADESPVALVRLQRFWQEWPEHPLGAATVPAAVPKTS